MEQDFMSNTLFKDIANGVLGKGRKTENILAASMSFKDIVPRRITSQMALLQFANDYQPTEQPSPPNKSDDIKKFIGNVYLEKEQFDKFADDKPLSLLSGKDVRDSIREQDFSVSNYYRTFYTRFDCLREVLLLYSRLLNKQVSHIREVMTNSLSTKIKDWTKTVSRVIEKASQTNTTVSSFKHFKVQLYAQLENFDDLINKLLDDCRRINTQYDNRNAESFYTVMTDALATCYNQYTAAYTSIMQLVVKTDASDPRMFSFTSDSKYNVCRAEFVLLYAMQLLDNTVRKEQSNLSELYTAMVTLLKHLAMTTGQKVVDLKTMLLLENKLDSNDIVKGFSNIFDLEQLCVNSHIDISLFPGSLVDLLKKKVSSRSNDEALIDRFFLDYTIKYTKHSLLIRHRIECSTVGTNKRCILLLDVD